MGFKDNLKALIEEISGFKLYKKLPFGNDPIQDIHTRIKHFQFNIIFDVGANIGQSAIYFHAKAPNSIIYSFEPSINTYQILKENVQNISSVNCYQVAIGNEEKDAKLLVGERSDQNRIIKEIESNYNGSSTTENIKMETLTGFCRSNNINHINYLKIDTEGFDLEVLKSGAAMLKERTIDFVETEVGMNPTNTLHVPINEMKKFMESYEYYVLGIYEQKNEWIEKKPFLRRTNLLFISPKLVN